MCFYKEISSFSAKNGRNYPVVIKSVREEASHRDASKFNMPTHCNLDVSLQVIDYDESVSFCFTKETNG